MAKKAERRSRVSEAEAAEGLPEASMLRRIGWVALAALWLFAAVSMVSFDPADAPSHLVAVHNDPPSNLCGAVGALVSYGLYLVLGAGTWVLLIAAAVGLGITVTGRALTHPFVRSLGFLLIAIAFSGLHALLLPDLGPMVGAPSGVVAQALIDELVVRFNPFGTALLLAAGVLIGAVVAIDRFVFAVPAMLYRFSAVVIGWLRDRVMDLRSLGTRPEAASAKTKKSKSATTAKASSKKSKKATLDTIDPDAGGIGGTEAFDPDAEAEDEEEWEWEYDEDEEDVEDEDDADVEWEYDDEDYDEDEDEEEDEDGVENEEDAAVTSEEEQRRLSAEELRAKIAKLPVRMGARTQTIARDEDIPREENFEGYQFPTLDLLDDPETNFSEELEQTVRSQAESLENALQTYGIEGEVVGIESGPTVTLYSVQLAPGTKVAKVNAISSDLARSLSAPNIRVVANMAGKTSIGIEVPNLKKEKVRLKELMSGGHAARMRLPMFLGKDASGEPLVADLTRMPHMLIAGTTGSGKSVCLNTIIMSWLYVKRPDELKMVLVDPKMVELSQFQDIPHLMCPVVTEMGRAAAILEWAVNKMEERYELLKEARVRDVVSYNELGEEALYEAFDPQTDEERAKIPKKLPYIVFIIDELADLMLTNKEVEQSIVRIAQKARAVGIHLILATQRPQANVVTGLIKSNMPCRVSFKVASGMDSRIVLDAKGAELLLGMGDMMMLTPSSAELKRSQGTLVSDTEIRKVTKHLRDVAAPTFERSLLAIRPSNDEATDPDAGGDLTERDARFDEAVEIMIESGRGSVSLLQRRMGIGYSRASRLVDQMGLAGILGEHKGSVARDVMITMEDWYRMKELEAIEEARGTVFEGDEDGDGDGTADIEVESKELKAGSVPAEMDGEYLD